MVIVTGPDKCFIEVWPIYRDPATADANQEYVLSPAALADFLEKQAGVCGSSGHNGWYCEVDVGDGSPFLIKGGGDRDTSP